MLGGGPGVGKTRLAMEMAEYASGVGFRCSVGHCYERDEPFPYLPIVEIIENNIARAASLMITVDGWETSWLNWPRLLQVFDESFPIFRRPLELPPAQKRRYLLQSVSEALAQCDSITFAVTMYLKIFIGPTNRRWRF